MELKSLEKMRGNISNKIWKIKNKDKVKNYSKERRERSRKELLEDLDSKDLDSEDLDSKDLDSIDTLKKRVENLEKSLKELMTKFTINIVVKQE